MVFQSLLWIGSERCFERVYFPSQWVFDASVLFVQEFIMKDEFELYGDGIKPVKATGTWIDHQMQAMHRLVDEYGL